MEAKSLQVGARQIEVGCLTGGDAASSNGQAYLGVARVALYHWCYAAVQLLLCYLLLHMMLLHACSASYI